MVNGGQMGSCVGRNVELSAYLRCQSKGPGLFPYCIVIGHPDLQTELSLVSRSQTQKWQESQECWLAWCLLSFILCKYTHNYQGESERKMSPRWAERLNPLLAETFPHLNNASTPASRFISVTRGPTASVSWRTQVRDRLVLCISKVLFPLQTLDRVRLSGSRRRWRSWMSVTARKRRHWAFPPSPRAETMTQM